MIPNLNRSLFIFIIISLFLHFVLISSLSISFKNDEKNNIVEIQLIHKAYSLNSTNSPPFQANSINLASAQIVKNSLSLKRTQTISQVQPVFDTVTLGINVEYPRLSRLLEEQGQVVLLIIKNTQGDIENIQLEKSSGFSRLDNAALEAVKNYNLNEITTAGDFKISFVFKLKKS